MNIFEIIAKVGEIIGYDQQNEVMLQLLTQGDSNISILKKEAKITFYTELEKGHDLIQISAADRKYTPVLIWLPKEALDEAVKKINFCDNQE